MNYLKDDDRLLTQLQSRKQLIKQQEIKMKKYQEESRKRSSQISSLSQMNELLAEKHANEIVESGVVYSRVQEANLILSQEIMQLKMTIGYYKTKNQSIVREKDEEIQGLKAEIEINKSDYMSKVRNLEENLALLKRTYHVEEGIERDREQIIKDSSKDKDGAIKGVILHSKQLAIELESQSEQIVVMLQKIEKANQQVVRLRRQVDIQKEVEVGLVKRSTVAQNLVRQLNQRNKDLELENETLRKRASEVQTIQPSPSLETEPDTHEINSLRTELNTSNIEISKLRNEINYLYNKIRLHQTKFEGLATILSQHLQNLLMANKDMEIFGNQSREQPYEINISELREKDVMEWKPQETSIIIYLLLAQIRSIISKKNLISLPELKNPNVSMIDESVTKQTINLPKISTQYNDIVSLEQKKPSRFKGIPLDISTKIVRSELRNWGVKVGVQKKNNKSLSMYSKNGPLP